METIIKANIKKRNGQNKTVEIPSRRLIPVLKRFYKVSFRKFPGGGFVSATDAMAVLPDEMNVTGFGF